MLQHFVDKAYEGKDLTALADAPVDALEGVSKGDAEALKAALGIKTIRDLAQHRAVRIAQALTALADLNRK
jgi:hypothetical protein